MNFGFNTFGEATFGEIYESNQYVWTLVEFVFTIPVREPELMEISFTVPIVTHTPTLVSFKFTIPVIPVSDSVVVDVENPETPLFGYY